MYCIKNNYLTYFWIMNGIYYRVKSFIKGKDTFQFTKQVEISGIFISNYLNEIYMKYLKHYTSYRFC